MPTLSDIASAIREVSKHGEPTVDESCTPKGIKISTDDLVNVCQELIRNPTLFFDMLSCLTAIDNGVQVGTLEIAYNLYSIPFDLHLMLKITLPRENAAVESVSHIWKTATWHEREAFDMFGIDFKNHPDLRRILMPADWEGHPLRKDYVHQDYYRDVKVAY